MFALDCTLAEVLKRGNPYHDKSGAFTSKDKAVPMGAASAFAQTHSAPSTYGQIVARVLDEGDFEEFTEAEYDARELFNSGDTTKKQFTRPGSNTYTHARLAVHRAIMSKLIGEVKQYKPAEGEQPRVIMVGGRTGSGKSSFGTGGSGIRPEHQYDKSKFLVLDPDRIKELLPEYSPGQASRFHQESVDIFDKMATFARNAGLNVVLDFTMSTDRVAWARSFKERGYQTEAHYIHRPPEKAAESMVQRWTKPVTFQRLDGSTATFPRNRIVPLDRVMEQRQNEKYFDRLARFVDSWSLYDNSGDRFNPRYVTSGGKARKSNPYHDATGAFTSKEKATTISQVLRSRPRVKAGWYVTHGGSNLQVDEKGIVVYGGSKSQGKLAEPQHLAKGPFKTKGGLQDGVIKPKAVEKLPEKIAETPKSVPSKTGPVDLSQRSKNIETLLKSGAAPKHAILQVKIDGGANNAIIDKIGSGSALDRARNEYSQTPTQDLQVLTGIEVHPNPVSGQAHCTFSRKVVMGSSSVTGDFRHELGHAIHMSLSQSLQKHAEGLYTEAMSKAKANPAGLNKKLDHEFYETNYGVIGRRALDNWHENFAEHYRGYQKAVYQMKSGKDPQALDRYTQRFPKWSQFWDAYYAGGTQ